MTSIREEMWLCRIPYAACRYVIGGHSGEKTGNTYSN